MTELKEQAISLICGMPDENMTYILGILKNVEALTAQERGPDKKMANFFAAAGKVQIDSDAIDKLRHESMV